MVVHPQPSTRDVRKNGPLKLAGGPSRKVDCVSQSLMVLDTGPSISQTICQHDRMPEDAGYSTLHGNNNVRRSRRQTDAKKNEIILITCPLRSRWLRLVNLIGTQSFPIRRPSSLVFLAGPVNLIFSYHTRTPSPHLTVARSTHCPIVLPVWLLLGGVEVLSPLVLNLTPSYVWSSPSQTASGLTF
jgi:hypothetical protein